jgi:hypothetical protein
MRTEGWSWGRDEEVAVVVAADYSRNRNRARLVGKMEDKSAVVGDLVLPGQTERVGERPWVWRAPRMQGSKDKDIAVRQGAGA